MAVCVGCTTGMETGQGLSVINFPDSRTQSVKVTDWPVNFTGLLGPLADTGQPKLPTVL